MELSKVCRFVSNLVEKNRLVPENIPHAIAAGIIYYVGVRCGLKISKRAVSEISGISEVTVNKCYKKLDECDAKLIPTAVLLRYGGVTRPPPAPPCPSGAQIGNVDWDVDWECRLGMWIGNWECRLGCRLGMQIGNWECGLEMWIGNVDWKCEE
jgi:hypothetical protein